MSEESSATGISNSQPILQAMRDIALARDAQGILNALRQQVLKNATQVWLLQSGFELSGDASIQVAAAWPANPKAASDELLNAIHRTARMQPVFIADVANPGESSPLAATAADAFEKGGLAIVPLIGRDRTEGFIVAHYDDSKKMQAEDASGALAEHLAGPAAAMMENLRMMDRVQSALEETSTLYSTGLAMSAAQTTREIYEIALNEVASLSGGSRLELYTAGPDVRTQLDYVRLAASWETDQASLDGENVRRPIDEAPVLSQFPQTRANQYFDDMADDARLEDSVRKSYRERGVRSLLMLPLSSGSAWIGALLIESEQESGFTEEQIRLCRNICDQAAQAINNLLLLERTQRSVLRDQLIDSMTVELQRSYSVDKVLETTVRTLQPMLKNYDVRVRLSADAQDAARTAAATTDDENGGQADE